MSKYSQLNWQHFLPIFASSINLHLTARLQFGELVQKRNGERMGPAFSIIRRRSSQHFSVTKTILGTSSESHRMRARFTARGIGSTGFKRLHATWTSFDLLCG